MYIKKFGFTFNGDILRNYLWNDGTHIKDFGTNILAGNCLDYLNRFILFKSSQHL